MQAQKNQCDCEAFLSTRYTWEEHVYEQPDKKTELYLVGNNAMDEDFIHFAIQAQKGKMLQVAPYGIRKWYDVGWIENSHISVYGRNYVEPISIYKKDDTASALVFTVPVGYEPEYHVTGCNGKWLQIELLYED
ncbi:MAG: hypothetical protein KDC07_08675, partial [Chitinophagaceae bacterium]|nr:hypothetical protein [Chitinophagaceae bacterium]